jgi:hypothetical protein
MSERNDLLHSNQEPLQNQPDTQAEEVELSQPAVAEQAHQLIEEIAQAMTRHPNFNADDNAVDFLDADAYHVLQVQREHNPQTDIREEKLEYRIANRKRIGESDWWTTPVSLLSVYNETDPQGGYIRLHDKRNTSNPTTSLECIAKICLCKIAGLRSSATSISSSLDAPNSLCLKTRAYKCRCRANG